MKLLFVIAVRCVFMFPAIVWIKVISEACGDPDALETSGNMMSMWMLAGKSAPCNDIRALAERRAFHKIGDWL